MDLSNENVIHVKKGNIEYLQFKKLLEYKDIINHAYSLGIDRNFRTARANKEKLSKEEYTKALKDYEELCSSIGSDYKNVIKTNQEHTDEVKVVNRKIKNGEPDINLENYSKTDGLITNQTNQILSTTNADCILLLFFDPVKKVIANTHSGWRGTLQRISIKTVEKMKKEFSCNPEDIICCIAPSIRKCHFEVEKDVQELFYDEFKELEEIDKIIVKISDKNKWTIDTIKINKIILKQAGVKEENIIDSGICSVCDSDLIHSFRVEGKEYKLNTALVELK